MNLKLYYTEIHTHGHRFAGVLNRNNRRALIGRKFNDVLPTKSKGDAAGRRPMTVLETKGADLAAKY